MRLIPAALAGLVIAGGAEAACRADLVEVEGRSGLAAFEVEVAATEDARARGLMFRTELARDAGMLFVFESARDVAFWMKNTPLSLDMLFIDARGVVCGMDERTEPYSLTPRPSRCAARAVLEVNGGVAGTLGIAIGARARHPAFGPEAALPCPAVAP